jgi:hypothetical protein
MRNLRRRMASDEGSLMVSLLAVLILTSLVAVTIATVATGQKQTRFDNSFERALQVAEYGLDEMAALVQSDPTAPDGAFAPIEGEVSSGGKFATTATRTGDVWTIESTGVSPDGRERRLQAQVEVTGLFNLAVFGKIFVDFNGGNGASSYNSESNSTVCHTDSTSRADVVAGDFSVEPCFQTGQGVVATNGKLFLKGQAAADADRMEIHFARDEEYLAGLEPLEGATGYCNGVPATCGAYNEFVTDAAGDSVRRLSYFRKPIELPAITVCDGLGAPSGFNGNGSLGGGVYNFTDVTLRESTVFTGTPENPTVICMSGKLTVPNHNAVNFEPAPAGGTQPRPPGSLFIFNRYSGTGTGIDMGTHAAISAAIYAPDASFQGGAQGNVFGTLIAHSIDNNGGWNFHYDEALGRAKINAPVRMSDWTEV